MWRSKLKAVFIKNHEKKSPKKRGKILLIKNYLRKAIITATHK